MVQKVQFLGSPAKIGKIFNPKTRRHQDKRVNSVQKWCARPVLSANGLTDGWLYVIHFFTVSLLFLTISLPEVDRFLTGLLRVDICAGCGNVGSYEFCGFQKFTVFGHFYFFPSIEF